MRACTFFGHSDCSEVIRPRLMDNIEKLIVREGVSLFYVGTHGGFDRIAYSVLCELEKKYDIKVQVVLAYMHNGNKERYYDIGKSVFPEGQETVPYRYAIIYRNQYMIEKSDFVICFVNDCVTNSHKFVLRAMQKGLKVINIGNYIFQE